jgi:hypothetical protein
MTDSKESTLTVNENEIIFHTLNNFKVVTDFIEAINQGQRNFTRSYILNFKKVKAGYPNTCAPIAGIIETVKASGVEFEFYYVPPFLKSTNVTNPLPVQSNKELLSKSALNKVWKFESDKDSYMLIDSLVAELSKLIIGEKGVLESFEWCLNEVTDNVLQHSTRNFGYVMAQVHKNNKHIAICVYDSGQGIYNSLSQSKHKPKNPVDALNLCIKKGITRDKEIGQGNGLWGLYEIVSENSGTLNITSNSASLQFHENKTRHIHSLPVLPVNNGTIVDFQVNYSKEISISKAMGGYQPVNIRLEDMENEFGVVQYKLKSQDSGTGSRQSGAKMRTEVINIYNQLQKPLILDFAGVGVVSSSFADELIGKLVAIYGFYGFNNIFKLRNMNETVQTIVQRSVAQRMNESFNKDK